MGIVEDVRSDIVALVRSLPDAALLELARVALGSAPSRRYRCSSCGEAGHRASTCGRAARPETAALPQVAAPDVPAVAAEAVAVAETAPAEAPAPPAVPADNDDDEREQEQPEEPEADADSDDNDDIDEPSSGARLLGPVRKREPEVDWEDAAPEPTSPRLKPEVARLEEILTAHAREKRVRSLASEGAEADVEPDVLRDRLRLRARRARPIRALSLNMKRLPKRDILAERVLYPEAGRRQLPMFRSECESGPRPCPYVSCKHHLFLDVSESTGAIKLNFPDLQDEDGPRLDEMLATCALDVAELGGVTLEIAGDVLNVTRERLRQIEVDTMTRLARRPALRQLRESA